MIVIFLGCLTNRGGVRGILTFLQQKIYKVLDFFVRKLGSPDSNVRKAKTILDKKNEYQELKKNDSRISFILITV